jgi:hypothetical protein
MMADEQQLAVLRQGSDAWNAWREQNLYLRVDLSEADLTGADLTEANLFEADLSGANFTRANLTAAYLYGADLREAYLTRAGLHGADLTEVELTGASLAGADLNGAIFIGANLSRANLTRAILVGTNFRKADLTGCRVYGISAWDLGLEGAKQKDLIITPVYEAEITVDNLEVAQFIYLLLNNERVRHVIETITSKVVLILGRFTPERKAVLDLFERNCESAATHRSSSTSTSRRARI